MDMMGDAEELEYDDEPPPPRPPLLTTETLAVTSLALAVCSMFVTSVSQYAVFLLANALGLNEANSQTKQFALAITPVAVLSFIAVVCGATAVKRRSDDRWVVALAGAGLAVGAMIFVIVAIGFLLLLTGDGSTNFGE
jgi:hypothetical protein